jgi:hypothetical protein
MPDEPAEDDATEVHDRVFSTYGIISAVLGVAAVVAVVLGAIIWTGHRHETGERAHQGQVLQAAAEWTSVLINMNKDTVADSLQKLHEGTVGGLNADFDTAIQPYRQLVERLQTRTTGQIDSVSIERIYHAPEGPTGAAPPQQQQPELAEYASRTDTVLVVATSVSENAGGDKPQTVRWNLRLDVSEADGKLLISRLEPIR